MTMQQDANALYGGLESTMQALADISNACAFCKDKNGSICWKTQLQPSICACFDSENKCKSSCAITLTSASDAATYLNEPYIFMCPAGLMLLACPRDEMGRSFYFGPLVMGRNSEDAAKSILLNFSDGSMTDARIRSFLSTTRIWTHRNMSELHNILYRSTRDYSGSLTHGDDDRRVPTGRRSLDPMPYTDTIYPEQPEKEILTAIIAKDMAAAVDAFRLFYEKSYLHCSGDFFQVRVYILGMFNFLSGRLNTESATSFFMENIERLSRASGFNELYNYSEAMIRRLTDNRFHTLVSSSPSAVRQVLHHIHSQFDQDISLSDAAQLVHLTAPYLSRIFKQETGQTFVQYLTAVRLNNACRYLRDSEIQLTEISTRCGFSSQSYFSRIFRKRFGVSPRHYRSKYHSLGSASR